MTPQQNEAFTQERLQLAVQALIEVAVSRGLPLEKAQQVVGEAAFHRPAVEQLSPQQVVDRQKAAAREAEEAARGHLGDRAQKAAAEAWKQMFGNAFGL